MAKKEVQHQAYCCIYLQSDIILQLVKNVM